MFPSQASISSRVTGCFTYCVVIIQSACYETRQGRCAKPQGAYLGIVAWPKVGLKLDKSLRLQIQPSHKCIFGQAYTNLDGFVAEIDTKCSAYIARVRPLAQTPSSVAIHYISILDFLYHLIDFFFSPSHLTSLIDIKLSIEISFSDA